MPDEMPMLLYHYTSAAALPSIIQTGGATKLYATHSDYLNDTSEIRTGLDVLSKTLESTSEKLNIPEGVHENLTVNIKSAYQKIRTSPSYLTCLSETIGLVDQWRGYGESGFGFALGYSVMSLADCCINTPDTKLVKCTYAEEAHLHSLFSSVEKANEYVAATLKKHPDFLEKMPLFEENIHLNFIGDSLLGMKHEAFVQEREWRLVTKSEELKFRPGPSCLIPYTELDLPIPDKIFVGPSPDQDRNKAALQLLLKTRMGVDAEKINIEIAEIPFRG